MAWTNALDSATPLGSNAPSVIDDHIRLIKAALQERMNSDHYWPLTGTAVSSTDAGKHRKVTLQAVLSSKPTLLTGEAAVYSKTVSGASEAFVEDSAGNEIQLTSGGALNVLISNIQGILTNDTYFTGIDNAGTGTTELIKAGQNEAADTDVAILPDLARLASNAAPLEDTALANKKYVDDSASFGTRSLVDSESNAFLKDHVYLAEVDGIVYALAEGVITYLKVGATSGAVTTVLVTGYPADSASGGNGKIPMNARINAGEYWELTGAPTDIYWHPTGSGDCVDQTA